MHSESNNLILLELAFVNQLAMFFRLIFKKCFGQLETDIGLALFFTCFGRFTLPLRGQFLFLVQQPLNANFLKKTPVADKS